MIIVGAGISGLYLAYRILQKNKIAPRNIHIIERSNRPGGCICTYSFGVDESYEAGACRLKKNQKLVHQLLQEFAIDITPIDDEKQYLKKGEIVESPNLNEHVQKIQKWNESHLKSMSFFNALMESGLSLKECQDLRDSFGYTVDFEKQNAYDAVQHFLGDLSGEGYCVVKGGLSRLVNELYNDLKSKGVDFRMNIEVLDITREDNKFKLHLNIPSRRYIYTKHLFLCLPRHSLRKFSLLKDKYHTAEMLKQVAKQPLMRVYAKIPKYKEWMTSNGYDSNKKLTTSDCMLKYIIPINDEIVMIAYCDGRFADYWKEIEDMEKNPKKHGIIKNYLKNRIVQEMNKISPLEKVSIGDIKYAKGHYWRDCVHYWKPGECSDTTSNNIVHPLPGMFIASESYSQRQGWIEGALEQVEKVLKKITILH